MNGRTSAFLHTISHPAIALGGGILIAAGAVGYAYQASKVAPSGDYVAARLAPIAAVGESSSDLSFQVSGQVVRIGAKIGERVQSGTALVVLDQSSLLAQRQGAVANLEAAQAKLAALKAGTRPEQITVNKTAVTQAEESLRDAVRSSYITADDAVHNKVDQFFTNPRTTSATLSFTVSDLSLQNQIENERVALEGTLLDWQAYMNRQTFAATDPIEDGVYAQGALSKVLAFLDHVSAALAKTPVSTQLPLATLQGYQSAVNTARLNTSGSVTAITNATTALRGAQGVLTLSQAGATQNDINAAQAVVDAAQAQVNALDVSLRQTALIAPISGTVTALNAELGQTVSPGQVIVSIESSGGSKASALVVPKSAVIKSNGQAFVYLKGSSSKPVKTPVTIGLESPTSTEIVSGLSEGQEVLVFGTSI